MQKFKDYLEFKDYDLEKFLNGVGGWWCHSYRKAELVLLHKRQIKFFARNQIGSFLSRYMENSGIFS